MRSYFAPAYHDLTRRSIGSIPALDGLRAIAALLIIVFHCHVIPRLIHGGSGQSHSEGLTASLLDYGWVGVDIFFVLSGFLIARILFVQAADQGIDFKSFYVKRAFRIFPAYYFVLTLSLFCFSHVQLFSPLYGGAPFGMLLERSPFNYFYLANYAFPADQRTALTWGWSLCIEEHFYLVFPVLTTVIFRMSPANRLRAFIAACFIPLIFRAGAFLDHPAQIPFVNVYFKSHMRADGLMVGCVLAYTWVFHREGVGSFARRLGHGLWVLGVLGLGLAWWSGGSSRPGLFPVVLQFAVIGVSVGLMLLNCLYCQNGFTRLLGHRFWYPIARLSYGMYLVHLFAIIWLANVWPGYLVSGGPSGVRFGLFALASSILTIGAAAILYFSFEYRLLLQGKGMTRR
jgi:peptidoglycan/LPS O-acetylase OafA/YrhL